MTEPAFKGPGHWRSQAEQARHPDNVFAHLAEYRRLLGDAGEAEAQQLVIRATRQAKAGDPEDAADLVRQAAGRLGHVNAHLSAGLLSVADKLRDAPREDDAEPDEEPGLAPHLED
jgi:hypothetical protein